MKYIRLTEKLVLRPDIVETGKGIKNNHSYVVGQYAIGKDGKEFIKDPKYFTNMAYLLEYALNETIRDEIYDGKIQTLKELADAFKRVRCEFMEALGIPDEPEVKDY